MSFFAAALRLCGRLFAVLLVLLAVNGTTPAADRFWINPDGGSFSFASNWSTTSGGSAGASAPGPADVALFDLAGDYQVFFGNDVFNTRLIVEDGDVQFDLGNQTYTLILNSDNQIGRVANQTAQLTITDGVLAVESVSDSIDVGDMTDDSHGELTVAANGVLGTVDARPNLRIGAVGHGTLTVQSGGKVNANQLDLGAGIAASGVAIVRDLGSVLDAASRAEIGQDSSGMLTVSLGGQARFGSTLNIGSGDDAEGSVHVTDVGSQLSVVSTLRVGDSGVGVLGISGGGRVVTESSDAVGMSDSATGSVSVSGAGSSWQTGGSTTIGEAGAGELDISGGGQVTSGASATLGKMADSFGRAAVVGAGSSWSSDGLMKVGDGGFGELTVSDGGSVAADSITVGEQSGSTGHLLVQGAGSTLTASGDLIVGQDGEGSLAIADDGAVFVGGAFQAENDEFDFADGLLQVAGDFVSSPLFSVNGVRNDDRPIVDLIGDSGTESLVALTVGSNRQGEFRVRQGRSVIVNNSINIASQPGSQGRVLVESGGFLSTQSLAVGGSGSTSSGGAAMLEIGAGGFVDAAELHIWSDGVVHLNGGQLTVESISFAGSGQFDWDVGTLEFDQNNATLDEQFVSQVIGPSATLRTGQTLDALPGQNLTLTTPLSIDGGQIRSAKLTNESTLIVSSGVISGIVDNSGIVSLEGPLASIGITSVDNSGAIRGTGRVVGPIVNQANGDIEVTHGERMVLEGNTVNNAGRLSVIGGELVVHGSLTNANATGLISARDAILRFHGGVDNDGGIAFSNGVVDVYGDIVQRLPGRITVSGGGIANFYDDVFRQPNSADVQATAVGSTVSRVVFFGAYNGGVTGGGDAFIEGDHRPGNSPAEVHFDGNLSYGPFSRLEIEIAGRSPGTGYDRVDVDGEAALTGALTVSLLDGFEPGAGDLFEILAANGGIFGTFTTVDLPPLVDGLHWNLSYDADQVVLGAFSRADGNLDGNVDGRDLLILQRDDPTRISQWEGEFGNNGSGATVDAVPEPTTQTLLLAALLWRRRRRAS